MSERQFHKDLRMFLMQLSIYSYEGRDPFAKGLCADALASIPQWISVDERLPEDGESVLAYLPPQPYCPNPTVGEAVYAGKGNWSTEHGGWFHVTHWMPLPEPPEVQ